MTETPDPDCTKPLAPELLDSEPETDSPIVENLILPPLTADIPGADKDLIDLIAAPHVPPQRFTEIARGGLGAVFLMDGDKAVKVRLNNSLNKRRGKLLQLFFNYEAAIMEYLAATYPEHFLKVHEIVRDTNHNARAIIMQYFPGESIRSALAKDRHFNLTEVIAIACQQLRILQCLADQQIVHRDVAISNILVSKDKQRTALIDFGLTDSPLSFKENPRTYMLGRARYCAPEQFRRLDDDEHRDLRILDHRSDLYAFGICFYEMIAGKYPYRMLGKKTSLADFIFAHLQLAPLELPEYIPLSLSRIINKLLEKDPQKRYQQAAEVLVDLEVAKVEIENAEPSEKPVELTCPISDTALSPAQPKNLTEIKISPKRSALWDNLAKRLATWFKSLFTARE